jgi:hypothetical protein
MPAIKGAYFASTAHTEFERTCMKVTVGAIWADRQFCREARQASKNCAEFPGRELVEARIPIAFQNFLAEKTPSHSCEVNR